MCWNGYLWTSGVHLDTAVRFADPDLLLKCKISAIWRRFPFIFAFYMLSVFPSYFYFWFVWPFDLESIPHASTPTSIILTKFEVDMTFYCRVISFLSAVTSRDLVTLTFDLLTLNSCHTWRVTWQTLPPSLKTLCLSVLELGLWVITLPVGYHWKCVRGQCACGESRDRPRFIETTVYDVSVIFYASNLLRFCLLSKHFTTSVK